MRKFFLFILALIAIFSEMQTFALSYEWLSERENLKFYSGWTFIQLLDNAKSPSFYSNYYGDNSNYHRNYYGVQDPINYYLEKTSLWLDSRTLIFDTIAELDFSGVSGDVPYVLASGKYYNTINYDIYLSGSDILYRVFDSSISPLLFLVNHTFHITDIPSDYSTINFWWLYPKRAVFRFQHELYSMNSPLVDWMYLDSFTIQKVTSISNVYRLSLWWNRDAWLKLSNSYQSLGYWYADAFWPAFWYWPSNLVHDCYTLEWYWNSEICQGFRAQPELFPYMTVSEWENYRMTFPKSWYMKYVNANDTVYLVNDDGELTNSWYIANSLSQFYLQTWSLFIECTASGCTSDIWGWSWAVDHFAACTSFLDVGCYVQATWYTVKDFIFSLFPTIDWTWSSATCVIFSWSTASGLVSPISYSWSSKYIQNIANFLSLMVPVPPPEGTRVCLLWGNDIWKNIYQSWAQVNIHYGTYISDSMRIPSFWNLTVFDLMLLVIVWFGWIHLLKPAEHHDRNLHDNWKAHPWSK